MCCLPGNVLRLSKRVRESSCLTGEPVGLPVLFSAELHESVLWGGRGNSPGILVLSWPPVVVSKDACFRSKQVILLKCDIIHPQLCGLQGSIFILLLNIQQAYR